MDHISMSMTEFMVRYGENLGWPKDHVERMAARQLECGQDFQIVVRQVHITVPKDTINDYLTAEAKRLTGEIKRREAEVAAAISTGAPAELPKPVMPRKVKEGF